MARFFGQVRGRTGRAVHRLGHSDIKVDANTWDFGISVYGYIEKKKEVFEVYITGGSNDPTIIKKLGKYSKKDIIHRKLRVE